MTELLSGRGEVIAFTTIYDAKYVPPGHEDQVPYVIALVKPREMDKPITAQLTDLTWHKETRETEGGSFLVDIPDVEIGMEVEMVTRKLQSGGNSGIIIYGYKFRPPLPRVS